MERSVDRNVRAVVGELVLAGVERAGGADIGEHVGDGINGLRRARDGGVCEVSNSAEVLPVEKAGAVEDVLQRSAADEPAHGLACGVYQASEAQAAVDSNVRDAGSRLVLATSSSGISLSRKCALPAWSFALAEQITNPRGARSFRVPDALPDTPPDRGMPERDTSVRARIC